MGPTLSVTVLVEMVAKNTPVGLNFRDVCLCE
jgi:hypothetical protein